MLKLEPNAPLEGERMDISMRNLWRETRLWMVSRIHGSTGKNIDIGDPAASRPTPITRSSDIGETPIPQVRKIFGIKHGLRAVVKRLEKTSRISE